ncbi:hypothetical protein FNF28_06086 [Cafeteria roenbergensis]|uniref:Tyrosine specific protein phosphatases domain-containing protein n=1 Tax=Cafeteria roenbergensis TaxID=33653 RepID=A0A5A8D4I7_CAFRO|nr:hypothetical protein FNF28_06086 [Cafeteria roenbergensis]
MGITQSRQRKQGVVPGAGEARSAGAVPTDFEPGAGTSGWLGAGASLPTHRASASPAGGSAARRKGRKGLPMLRTELSASGTVSPRDTVAPDVSRMAVHGIRGSKGAGAPILLTTRPGQGGAAGEAGQFAPSLMASPGAAAQPVADPWKSEPQLQHDAVGSTSGSAGRRSAGGTSFTRSGFARGLSSSLGIDGSGPALSMPMPITVPSLDGGASRSGDRPFASDGASGLAGAGTTRSGAGRGAGLSVSAASAAADCDEEAARRRRWAAHIDSDGVPWTEETRHAAKLAYNSARCSTVLPGLCISSGAVARDWAKLSAAGVVFVVNAARAVCACEFVHDPSDPDPHQHQHPHGQAKSASRGRRVSPGGTVALAGDGAGGSASATAAAGAGPGPDATAPPSLGQTFGLRAELHGAKHSGTTGASTMRHDGGAGSTWGGSVDSDMRRRRASDSAMVEAAAAAAAALAAGTQSGSTEQSPAGVQPSAGLDAPFAPGPQGDAGPASEASYDELTPPAVVVVGGGGGGGGGGSSANSSSGESTLPPWAPKASPPGFMPLPPRASIGYLTLNAADANSQDLSPLMPYFALLVEHIRACGPRPPAAAKVVAEAAAAAAAAATGPNPSPAAAAAHANVLRLRPVDRPSLAPALLTHCHQGVSRSGTLTLAHVMWALRLPFEEALPWARTRRGIISPNPGFTCQLLELEDALLSMAAEDDGAPGQSLPAPATGGGHAVAEEEDEEDEEDDAAEHSDDVGPLRAALADAHSDPPTGAWLPPNPAEHPVPHSGWPRYRRSFPGLLPRQGFVFDVRPWSAAASPLLAGNPACWPPLLHDAPPVTANGVTGRVWPTPWAVTLHRSTVDRTPITPASALRVWAGDMIDSAVALAARKSSAGSTGSAASASDVDAATPAASADAAAPGTAYRHPKSGANSPPLPQDAVLVLLPRRLRPASIPPSPRDDDAEAAVGRPVVSARSRRRLGAAGSAPRKHSVVAVERTWPVDSALLVMRADLSLARRAALEHAVRVELAVWDAMASALPSRSVVLGTSDDVTATGPSPRSALQEVAAVVAASSRSRRASSSSTSGTRSLQLLPSLQVGVLGALPSGTLVADAVAAAALQTLGVVLPVRRLQAVPPSESLRKLAVESPAHASGQATAAATAAAAAARGAGKAAAAAPSPDSSSSAASSSAPNRSARRASPITLPPVRGASSPGAAAPTGASSPRGSGPPSPIAVPLADQRLPALRPGALVSLDAINDDGDAVAAPLSERSPPKPAPRAAAAVPQLQLQFGAKAANGHTSSSGSSSLSGPHGDRRHRSPAAPAAAAAARAEGGSAASPCSEDARGDGDATAPVAAAAAAGGLAASRRPTPPDRPAGVVTLGRPSTKGRTHRPVSSSSESPLAPRMGAAPTVPATSAGMPGNAFSFDALPRHGDLALAAPRGPPSESAAGETSPVPLIVGDDAPGSDGDSRVASARLVEVSVGQPGEPACELVVDFEEDDLHDDGVAALVQAADATGGTVWVWYGSEAGETPAAMLETDAVADAALAACGLRLRVSAVDVVRVAQGDEPEEFWTAFDSGF